MKYSYLFFVLTLLAACTGGRSTRGEDLAFTAAQRSMIMDASGDVPMRVYKIDNYSDSILLRTPSARVEPDLSDAVLSRFIDRLYATVRDSMSMGVGIAAPQVGILKRVIWVQRFDKEGYPFEVYLNPTITEYSDKTQQCREGCLSIPNRSDTLNSRAYSITIDYDRRDGTHHTEVVDDFTAVIFQHEIDHLDGILYLDHLARERREARGSW